MGTQGPGRKRIPNREKLTAEDDALNQIAREAEARLAAKRAARAEAREIRMKELERQQKEMSDDEERMSVGSRGSFRPSDYGGFLGSSSRASSRASSARASPVVEERPDRDFVDKGSRTASTLSAATLASLGGASSRRGSCDTSFSVETEASIRDMKDALAEAEEKYRKAMVSNAQLHNEKSTLMYQVETLKEELSDLEEVLWESRRHCDDKSKELERERQAHGVLQFQFKEMKETLRQTEELLTEVSDLRVKSSSYCQEVSDLQEALQWKEKKMAALERQREISDIVRIERDHLRDEVLRLRDLLKKHGVVVPPDVSTNGEAGRGEEDDVSSEERSHGGRESTLGRAAQQLPAGGSRAARRHIYKRSQSLNVLSARTRPDPVRPAQRSDLQARDRPGQKPPLRYETTKKPHGDLSKTSKLRPDTRSWFRAEGAKKQLMTNEPKAAEAPGPVCPGRIRPHTGSQMKSSTGSDQDPVDLEVPCDDPAPRKSPGAHLLSTKVQRSRLVPPRPAKDIILDHKASARRTRPNSEEPKLDVVTEDESPSSHADVLQKCFSAAETELRTCRNPPEVQMFPPAEETFTPEEPEEPENPTDEEEPQREAPLQIQDQTEGWWDPPETSWDWTGLENSLQILLSRCEAHPGVFPASLGRWFEDFKEMLKNFTAQCKAKDQEDSPGGGPGPEGLQQTASMKDLVSAQSLEVLHQTDDVDSRKDWEVLQDPPAGDHQEPAENTVKVSGSTSEEKPAEEEEPGRSDPLESSSSEDFVFVESYFTEPAGARLMWSGSDQGSGDPANTQRVPRSQSGLELIVESVETQLKRHRTPSSSSQRSKVKRLLETTAGEIRAMAVPELVLMHLQDGTTEDPPDMDSCEEVNEEAQEEATQQQRQPVATSSAASGMKRHGGWTGVRQTSRTRKTHCRVS